MAINKKKFNTLRELLPKAKDVANVMDFFLNNFGRNDEFIDASERCACPDLELMLRQIGQQIYKREYPLQNVLFLRYAPEGFIHGSFTIAGHLGMVIFFEESLTGVTRITDGKNSQLVRFSARQDETMNMN